MAQAPRPDLDQVSRRGRNGTADSTPFGLGPAETALLTEIMSEAAGPLGIDGAALIEGLAEGRTLGEALRLPPGLGDVLYANAHTWFAAGRHDRAETLFRALCVLKGGVADHWVGYGICLRLSERAPEASLAFATAVALRPDWALARFHAAGAAIAQADWAAASDHLDVVERHIEAELPPNLRPEATRMRLAVRQHLGAGRSARAGGAG